MLGPPTENVGCVRVQRTIGTCLLQGPPFWRICEFSVELEILEAKSGHVVTGRPKDNTW